MIYSKLLLTYIKCSDIEDRQDLLITIFGSMYDPWDCQGLCCAGTLEGPHQKHPRTHICIALTQPHVKQAALGVCGRAVLYQAEFTGFFLAAFHFSRHRCFWYDRWTHCIRVLIVPWLCRITRLFCNVLHVYDLILWFWYSYTHNSGLYLLTNLSIWIMFISNRIDRLEGWLWISNGYSHLHRIAHCRMATPYHVWNCVSGTYIKYRWYS